MNIRVRAVVPEDASFGWSAQEAGGKENGRMPIRISHFRIERELGRDGLGFVFDAVDEQLERPVTLRFVRASAQHGAPAVPEVRARFLDAARRAALLSHPNLVTIYEYRPLTETDLVVMERVEGETLTEMLGRGARWTVLDAARVLVRLADALAVAHQAGLVHGRVGPQNVRIRPDGRIKLMDLGLPKSPVDELAPPLTQKDDLIGLARLTCGLLAAAPAVARDATLASLRDPTMARARYGFLAPVLLRAIGEPDEGGFSNAGELRDALVVALDAATWRSSPDEMEGGSRWATRMVGPARAGAEERLPPDARALHALSPVRPSTGSRRIVLPPDLAPRPQAGDGTDTIERAAATGFASPPPPARRLSTRHLVAAVILVSVVLGGWIGVRQLLPGSHDATLSASERRAESSDGPATGRDPVSTNDDAPLAATGAAAEPPGSAMLAAMVRGSPPGTRITVVADPQRTWLDGVELEVAPGDTMLLRFTRAGYVTETHAFSGSRLAVTLQPDSVIATFRANVAAQVFLIEANGERLLGITDFERALPTGTHSIVYRSPGQEEWVSQQAMTGAGRRYAVEKMDYVTLGSFVGTVAGTWARISVDGGPERDTPAQFDDLSVGRHVVRVTREGFRTIVDTVLIRPAQIVTRQYTLQRSF